MEMEFVLLLSGDWCIILQVFLNEQLWKPPFGFCCLLPKKAAMRFWTTVWIVFIFACIGFTVREIPDAGLIWRFVRAAIRSNQYTVGGKLNVPAIITDKLIATNPEAADMLRYCLERSQKKLNMEKLAALVEKYPDNEFFLAQFAEELVKGTVVNPQAALLLVNKLERLNPDNAHYRYLRGWILLTDSNRPNREREALEQFELGHRITQFYLPYCKYKDRLDRLYRKVALFREWTSQRTFYLDLARRIFHSNELSESPDDDTYRDLSDSTVEIADRIIENAYDAETLLAGATLIGLREDVKLKNRILPEAEARQSRYRMARGVALLGIHTSLFESNLNAIFNIVWIMCVAPILFITALPFAFETIQEFIRARLGRSKPKSGKYLRIFLVVEAGMFIFVLLLLVLELLKKRPEGELPGFLVSMTVIFASWSALGLSGIHSADLAHLRYARLWLAFLCASLWFKGLVFWTAGKLSISTPDNIYGWLGYSGILLAWSILCAFIWVEVAYRPDVFTTKHRRRVAWLTYWVVILMILHVFGSLGTQVNSLSADPLRRYRPLPEATQDIYEQYMLGKGHVTSSLGVDSVSGIPGYLGFATPKDVETFIAQRRAAGRPIPERDLLQLLESCSRDVRPIILDALTDPNAFDVLVARAEWGDQSVKEPLERIFEEKLAHFTESEPNAPGLGELLELAGSMARVSDGPDGQDRLDYLLEYVVESTRSLGVGPSMTDPRHAERVMLPFWEALGKLPEGYATKLVKSYLRQTRYVDLLGDRGRDIEQLSALLADGDRELAEEVVGALAMSFVQPEPNDSDTESGYTNGMRLMQYRQRNSPYCLRAVFPHLGAKSIPLLLEYLNSDNDHLRAFIVWRLTSLGYKWPDDRLEVLRKDIDWKVRLNTLFASDAESLAKALNDKNAFVRVIAQLLVQAPPS